ncbi:uncharacterized protein PV09_05671 [Verruconis gallopava]|uniref:Peptidase C14 caspase domain-containing protein n=1 Tax=Verruconis gallopava TaxID=253628 RepID=A0A0D2A8G0_9PEZI|nr:uncharacterized protein PV09_05671 [Verruconis gallopava]KIW03013.1 hypothetical protein PV09_05671 [Verruconis gallopava]
MHRSSLAMNVPAVNPRRKALLIGINYTGSRHELHGCQQDVRNMIPFLQARGFPAHEPYMVVLADDRGGNYYPTAHNILAAMDWLVSEPGYSCFLHYSGHGGQVVDPYGDRPTGFNDTIVPVDFERAGQIDSGTLHRHLVSQLAPGCQLHIVFDCCHSGSAVELPYVYRSDGDGRVSLIDNFRQGVRLMEAGSHLIRGGFNFSKIGEAAELYAGAQSFFNGLKYMNTDEDGLGEEHFHNDWKAENKRVIMFSGCRDEQTSADATIGGSHVGAMSWAFLESMRRFGNQSYLQILQSTRQLLKASRYSQIPQMSVGQMMDLDQPLYL